jgi:hypothetical protein
MRGNLLPRVGQKRAVAKDRKVIFSAERSHSSWCIIVLIAFVSYRSGPGEIVGCKLTRHPPVEYWFC